VPLSPAVVALGREAARRAQMASPQAVEAQAMKAWGDRLGRRSRRARAPQTATLDLKEAFGIWRAKGPRRVRGRGEAAHWRALRRPHAGSAGYSHGALNPPARPAMSAPRASPDPSALGASHRGSLVTRTGGTDRDAVARGLQSQGASHPPHHRRGRSRDPPSPPDPELGAGHQGSRPRAPPQPHPPSCGGMGIHAPWL
jgi:hypothetical protein